MRTLFTMEPGTFDPALPTCTRYAVRGLIRRDSLLALQQDANGAYKLPGGGMEQGEEQTQTLRREVQEETGMRVIPGSERPFGLVLERRRDYRDPGMNFVQYSYCYLCDAEETDIAPAMTAQELSWGLHPVWVSLDEAIAVNRRVLREDWALRDTRILEMLRDTLNDTKEDML